MFRSTTRTCPVLSREEFIFDLRGQIVLLPGRTWRYVFFGSDGSWSSGPSGWTFRHDSALFIHLSQTYKETIINHDPQHISAPSPPPTPIPKPIPRGTAVGPCPSATSWVFGGCVQPQHSRVSFGASPRPSRCPKWRHSGPAGLMWHGGGICCGGGSPTKSWGSLR